MKFGISENPPCAYALCGKAKGVGGCKKYLSTF